MKQSAAAKAWDYIAMVAASAALSDILMQAFLVPGRLQSNIPAMAAVSGLVLAVLTVCFYNRRTAAAAVPAALLALAGCAVYLLRTGRLPAAPNIGLLIPVLFYLIAGGAAVAVFAFSRTRAGAALLFAVGAGAGCGMWLSGYTVNTPVYLAFLACAVLLFLRRQFQSSARRLPHVDLAQRHVTAAAAGITALALLVSFLAYNLTDWAIPSRFTAGRDILANWLQGGAVAMAGYDATGAETQLGAPLRSDGTPVMDVRTDQPFYLKGATFFSYTGHGWERQTDPDPERLSIYMNRQMVSGLWMPGFLLLHDPSAFDSLSPLSSRDTISYYRAHDTAVSLQTMTVTMRDSSQNIFLPAGYVDESQLNTRILPTGSISILDPNITIDFWGKARSQMSVTSSGGNDFEMLHSLSQGFSYSVVSPRYDMTSTEFQEAANAGSGEFERLVSKISAYYGISPLPEAYRRIYGEVNSQYSRPDTAVTARTRKLALSITRSSRTVSEKVEAVREYLSHGFTYTLTPKRTPQGRDFIDYFLFTGKEGYCVHFASAMTELLRCAGVPARYVEGYVAPSGSQDGVYHVTRNQAHAWVEVYSSLLGWYPVEATPGFSYVSESEQEASTSAVSAASSASSSEAPSQAESSSAASAVSSAPSVPGVGGQSSRSDLRILLSLILSGLALLLLLWLARQGLARLQLWRIRRLPAGEQAVRLYARFLRGLRWLGLSRRPEETPEEYAQRLSGPLGPDGPDFIRATRIFSAAQYGEQAPDAEELEVLWRFQRSFRRLCRRQAGRLRSLFGPPV